MVHAVRALRVRMCKPFYPPRRRRQRRRRRLRHTQNKQICYTQNEISIRVRAQAAADDDDDYAGLFSIQESARIVLLNAHPPAKQTNIHAHVQLHTRTFHLHSPSRVVKRLFPYTYICARWARGTCKQVCFTRFAIRTRSHTCAYVGAGTVCRLPLLLLRHSHKVVAWQRGWAQRG